MLMPSKVKFRKQQRGRRAGKAQTGSSVCFGDYGLKSLEAQWLTARQIEAAFAAGRALIVVVVAAMGKEQVLSFKDEPK